MGGVLEIRLQRPAGADLILIGGGYQVFDYAADDHVVQEVSAREAASNPKYFGVKRELPGTHELLKIDVNREIESIYVDVPPEGLPATSPYRSQRT